MSRSAPRTKAPIRRRIFVVGVPRSGTTLVQSLLAAHDQLATWTESHFFDRHFRRLPAFLGRDRDALLAHDPLPGLRAFLTENGEEGHLHPFPALLRLSLRVTPLRPFLTLAVARRLVAVLDELARLRGKASWLEKTPGHLPYLPFLERVAGTGVLDGAELHFVHVVRGGLDVVASLHRASAHWQRHYGLEECVERWNRGLALTLERFGQRPPTQRARDHLIVYERLVERPEAEVRRLLEAIGLGWQPGLLERYGDAASRVVAPREKSWKESVGRSIRPSSTAEEVLDDDARRRVSEALRDELYERILHLAASPT